MKKFTLFFIFFYFIFNIEGNAHAKYLEIVCTPDMEYGPGPDYKDKKIWFTNNKPKYVFHLDEENSMILKMGIAEPLNKYSLFKEPLNDKDIKTVNRPFEKTTKEIDDKPYPQYGFYTTANLSSNEDVVNLFMLTDHGGGQARYSFSLFVQQYRLKPEHTKLIAREMRNLSLSEFNRAREKVNEKTYMSIGIIKYFGAIGASCDYEFKK
jgi:hypothetical protein